MMHPSELFKRIHRADNYRHIGHDLSYKFFIDRADKIIYVCFQGSDGLPDWLHNLVIIPTRMELFEGCNFFVHKGFARVYLSGNDIIMEELRALTERLPDFEVIFGGFSHGSPPATFAAKNWFDLTGQKCKCHTFGSPMFAFGDNAQRILSNAMFLTNWINRADAVTRVPLQQWGFRHIREDLVNVKSLPILSLLRVRHHHQIYERPEIYPAWTQAS